MKKKVAVLAMCLMTFVGSTCLARIDADQVAIGGITLGSTMDYVESIYGSPSANFRRSFIIHHEYGQSFAMDSYNGYVTRVITTGHNGIATPGGVLVGMPADVLNDVYGKADAVSHSQGITIYHYRGSGTSNVLMFFINSNGVISEIQCQRQGG